jgi:hypothetical protein
MSESKVMLAGVESRQKEAAARKAEKLAQKANTKTVTQEDGEGFRRAFDAKQAAFLLDCQALTQQTTVKPGSAEAKDAYDVLWSRVNEINEQQVRAVMFLTAHDIGVCNKGIAEMKAACKDAKAALLPKKKFKFRSRKKKPSATPKVDPAALSSTSVATTAATVSTDTKIADLVKRSEAAVKRFTLQNLTDAKVSPSSADIAGKDCMICK